MVYQYTLPGIENLLSNKKSQAVGYLGEKLAAHLLELAGYDVVFARPGQRRGDLIAIDRETGETKRVEVKTARRGKDRTWRFTLWKKGHTSHRHADVVLLLAVLKSGRAIPFVIPIEAIRHRRAVAISSHPEDYNGKLARYRQKGTLRL